MNNGWEDLAFTTQRPTDVQFKCNPFFYKFKEKKSNMATIL